MILAVDVGNTNVTVGLFVNGVATDVLRFQTVPNRPSDEYAALLLPLMPPDLVEGVVVAGVVADVTRAWEELSGKRLGVAPLRVTSGFDFGFLVDYSPPQTVGVDRLVNIFAAQTLYATDVHDKKRACIVVDFGTATTLDVLTKNGVYRGGAIWPGVKLGMDTLAANTALPKYGDLTRSMPPKNVIGESTVACLASGLFHGEAARLDGLVQRTQRELGEECVVIVTGGFSKSIAPFSRMPDLKVVPDLTLQGLYWAYQRHVSREKPAE